MALPKENVAKAVALLRTVAKKKLEFEKIDYGNLTDQNRNIENKIILYGKCYDGGWENVCLNVRDITPEQLEMWHHSKTDVRGNTNFCQTENGLTTIGYI